MILSGIKIKESIRNGTIQIESFSEELLNPNSYNYRLGEELLLIKDEIIDPKKESSIERIALTKEGYLLEPGKLYLGFTKESIGSNKYVTQLIGRSSIGRLGLFLQVTAPLGHVGCFHNWTLELKCVQPLRVYPGMRIGQVTFWEVFGEQESNYHNGEYNEYRKAHVSKFYKEM